MSTQEEPTCGKGLAANSVLPAAVGDVLSAMSEVLQTHMAALDLSDEHSKREHEAYQRLVAQLSGIASRLTLTADEMASHHDLPMGEHDMQVLLQPPALEAFEKFVAAKQELLALLQRASEEDQTILDQMRQARG